MCHLRSPVFTTPRADGADLYWRTHQSTRDTRVRTSTDQDSLHRSEKQSTRTQATLAQPRTSHFTQEEAGVVLAAAVPYDRATDAAAARTPDFGQRAERKDGCRLLCFLSSPPSAAAAAAKVD